jgi:membrane-bound serine protease (ClpP class)
MVFVDGELWQATGLGGLAAGQRVQVVAQHGMQVDVTAASAPVNGKEST